MIKPIKPTPALVCRYYAAKYNTLHYMFDFVVSWGGVLLIQYAMKPRGEAEPIGKIEGDSAPDAARLFIQRHGALESESGGSAFSYLKIWAEANGLKMME